MSKYIMFSRVFPKGHPQEGKETNFIQKIWVAISVPLPCSVHADKLNDEMWKLFRNCMLWRPKYHTIRKGNRFKPGDKFSPRIWSGKPYASKQIIIADDIEVKKTWDIEIDENGVIAINGHYIEEDTYDRLALNDGLLYEDFLAWFIPDFNKPKPFKGQIICWNERVNY